MQRFTRIITAQSDHSQYLCMCGIHSVYLAKLWILSIKPVWKGQKHEQEMVKVASLRSDTDLDVSGYVRDDRHFPFVINIPFPQTTAKLSVDRSVVRSWAVICSSARPCCGMLPEDTGDHQWREWNEQDGFYFGGSGLLFFWRGKVSGDSEEREEDLVNRQFLLFAEWRKEV